MTAPVPAHAPFAVKQMPLMNLYVTNVDTLPLTEIVQHSPDASMFWVTFPLSHGWAIRALVHAESADAAEKIARETIRENWPQWKGVV